MHTNYDIATTFKVFGITLRGNQTHGILYTRASLYHYIVEEVKYIMKSTYSLWLFREMLCFKLVFTNKTKICSYFATLINQFQGQLPRDVLVKTQKVVLKQFFS